MPPDAILRLLRDQIGLDAASIGPRAVETAVERRMAALGLADADRYADRAAVDPDETQQLINAVVVPESWFFRNRGLFEFLAQHVREVLATRTDATPFRVLSLPCSGGEEPYSLAMACDQCGVEAARTRILGVDVSTESLARAQKAEYRAFAFRELDDSLRDRYFRETASIYHLDPAIRARVEFRLGNLLDVGALGLSGPFDLILCRNLLIYLTSDVRTTAIARLRDLLVPGGWLGVGHGEPLPAGHSLFDRVGPDRFLIYARRDTRTHATTAPRPLLKPAMRPTSPPFHPATATPRPSRPSPRPATPAPAVAVPKPTPTITEARRLADLGQIAAALAVCETLRRNDTPTADLCCLHGVLLGAQGRRDDAENALRRALYLDPNHPDALENLMLLLQQRGRHDEARRLRARLLRRGTGGDS